MNEVMKVGYYVGRIVKLRNKRALVRCNVKKVNGCLAQFDETSLEIEGDVMCYGWHNFKLTDFRFPLNENPPGGYFK
jgi:hypothetical protein